MLVRIPFASRSEQFAALRMCIGNTARRVEMNDYQVALVMSYFLEQLCGEIADDHVVRIPGFGAFGPMLFNSRKPGMPSRRYAGFSAARGLRHALWVGGLIMPAADMIDSPGLREFAKHRRHHHLSSRRGKRPGSFRTSMPAFRDRIRAEGRRLGYEVPGKTRWESITY